MYPGPTLQAALTRIIEGAINTALDLDPAGRATMLEVLAQPVQFSVTEPAPLTLTLSAVGQQVRVGSSAVGEPALHLSGQPLAFVALALGDNSVFASGRLTVAGDTATAHQFQRALDQLDPDWEGALARHIGDIPAHFIGQRLRGAIRWSKSASSVLNANVEEYIHEESRSLPGRRELEATFGDIDQLSLQVERLEARIEQLSQKAGSPDPADSSPEHS
ncbi:MAG: SCP2 sterol-binding domain-containing protein [Marinobacter sp.]|uniref:SCP2 domain-containing protein n=1 Tax=Marinobacter sp. TaxID=50741 RepID=UPI0034A05F5D